MAQFTEEEKMLRRIDKRFSKGVVEYGLIEDGDKILIGLSGGKDSLALVELLARRARVYKPRFSVVAVDALQALRMAHATGGLSGLVLDPFKDPVSLPFQTADIMHSVPSHLKAADTE